MVALWGRVKRMGMPWDCIHSSYVLHICCFISRISPTRGVECVESDNSHAWFLDLPWKLVSFDIVLVWVLRRD